MSLDTREPSGVYTATAGRREYLRTTSLAAEGMDWLQTPLLAPPLLDSDTTADIRRGYDFLATSVAYQRIRVPAEMLGPGMEPFDKLVRFEGAPLSPEVGDADTIMERLEDASFGKKVRTQLVGFGNVSEEIELRGTGALAGTYRIYVTLSPSAPSYGHATYYSDDGGRTGWVTSEVSLTPLFELRPTAGGDSIFVDTGVTPLPGFPMGLTSDSSRWSREPTVADEVSWTRAGESLFYPDQVLILAKDPQHTEALAPSFREHIAETLRRHTLPSGHPDHVADIEAALPGVGSMCAKNSARFRIIC